MDYFKITEGKTSLENTIEKCFQLMKTYHLHLHSNIMSNSAKDKYKALATTTCSMQRIARCIDDTPRDVSNHLQYQSYIISLLYYAIILIKITIRKYKL